MAPTKKPTRPGNAYECFMTTCRKEIMKLYPGKNIPMMKFSQQCEEQWRKLSDKKRFQDMAADAKRRYDKEMVDYKAVFQTKAKKSRVNVRKVKDPNAPKRALTPFFFFIKEQRALVKESNPKLLTTEIIKELGRLWHEADENTKTKYRLLANQDKIRYEKELTDYNVKCATQAKAIVNQDSRNANE